MSDYRSKLAARIAFMAYTQKEVAQKIKMSEMGFSNMMNGKTKNIHLSNVRKLMTALNCKASDILNRRDMLRYQHDLKKEMDIE